MIPLLSLQLPAGVGAFQCSCDVLLNAVGAQEVSFISFPCRPFWECQFFLCVTGCKLIFWGVKDNCSVF